MLRRSRSSPPRSTCVAMWDVVSRIKVGSVGFAYVVDAQGQADRPPRSAAGPAEARSLGAPAGARGARRPRRGGRRRRHGLGATGLARRRGAHARTRRSSPRAGWCSSSSRSPRRSRRFSATDHARRVDPRARPARSRSWPASCSRADGGADPEAADGAARIGAGDLAHRIDVRTGDELEALGRGVQPHRGAARGVARATSRTRWRQRTDELSRSVAELRALGEVSQAVNSTLDLQTVLTTIVTQAVPALAGPTPARSTCSTSREVFVPRANYGMSDDMIAALQRLAHPASATRWSGRCAAERAVRSRSPDLDAGAVDAGQRSSCARRLSARCRSSRCCARTASSARWWFAAQDAGRVSRQPSMRPAQTFAAQSVLAIQNARLFQRDPGEEPAARDREPAQVAVPRQHEPRAAHAAERDHRRHRDAARGRARGRADDAARAARARSCAPAGTCSP